MMAKTTQISETDFALIAVARVQLDLLVALGIDPKQADALLEVQQRNAQERGMTIAAGILGTIRTLATDPKRQQRRVGLQQLAKGHTKGKA
jgi:hypothetical protein